MFHDTTRFYNIDNKKVTNLTFFFLGLDIPKHGEPAYPLESYGDGWGSGKSPTADTMELPFTLQLKTTPSPEDPGPTSVQNDHPSMPISQELTIK